MATLVDEGKIILLCTVFFIAYVPNTGMLWIIMRRASEAGLFFLSFPRKKKPLHNGSHEHRVPKTKNKTFSCTRYVCV